MISCLVLTLDRLSYSCLTVYKAISFPNQKDTVASRDIASDTSVGTMVIIGKYSLASSYTIKLE